MSRVPVNAIVVGCGRMGKIGIRYLYEKGVRIVGAVDAAPALEGMDIGQCAGLGLELGIRINSDLDSVLETVDADIAVCALYSFLSANEEIFTKILKAGVNVITTCDEGHYAWSTAPEASSRLDKIAKKNGVTLTGCGMQDAYWMNLPYTASGGMREISRIEGVTVFNTEDYGPNLAEAYKVGRTIKEFEEIMASQSQEADAFLMRATNDALCAKFNLIPAGYSIEVLPYVKDHDVYSRVLSRIIPAGDVVGTKEIVTTKTRQGITVQSTDICYVYDEGEADSCTWNLYGKPNVTVFMPNVRTPELTMGTILNRLPDVIRAAPGYQTVDRLGIARFHVYPLELDM